MVDSLNKYCSQIQELRQKTWHPDTLFLYLQVAKHDFLPPEDWHYYFLDKKDLRFKIKEIMDFEI